MSMRELETKITEETREVLKNPKIRVKDIMEWKSGEIKEQHDGEINLQLPKLGLWVSVKKELDKRVPNSSTP